MKYNLQNNTFIIIIMQVILYFGFIKGVLLFQTVFVGFYLIGAISFILLKILKGEGYKNLEDDISHYLKLPKYQQYIINISETLSRLLVIYVLITQQQYLVLALYIVSDFGSILLKHKILSKIRSEK